MSIIVEHDKRRREILEKALDVFIEEGYEDVTFQKIADKCGITRTTLYIYFRNKRDIFNFSIKLLLSTLENDIIKIGKEKTLSCAEMLINIMTTILERLEENSRLLFVIMNYLIYISKGDSDPNYRVRRRTVRLRHILTNMLIKGKKSGEFAPVLNVKDANELLYALYEAAVFRLAVLRRPGVEELKATIILAVQRFVQEPNPLKAGTKREQEKFCASEK